MREKNSFREFQGCLKHLAFKNEETLGRRFEDDEEISFFGNMFNPFKLDVEKIRQSKAFRRLGDKTQVFPVNSTAHVRNRLIHTNEVVSLSYFMAEILGLNSDLAQAIALGHDIGHTPYGHLGERSLSYLSGKKFSHAVMGVVTAQKVERKGLGLNLSFETLEGILNHSRGGAEASINNGVSAEASLVMLADKIAYTFSDVNDALRLGHLKEKGLPKSVKFFGSNQRERLAKTIYALVSESASLGKLSFSTSPEANNFYQLRDWMYRNLYLVLDGEDNRQRLLSELAEIGEFFTEDFSLGINDKFLALAILTDSEAKKLSWKKRGVKSLEDFEKEGFWEILKSLDLKNSPIEVFSPDLEKKDFLFHRLSEY